MKFLIPLIVIFYIADLQAQDKQIHKTRFVIGLSGPELFHAGATFRLTNSNQLGISAGAGPSLGIVWTAFSAEHRLYLGKNSERTGQKTWFFRQGTTFFPSATLPSQRFTLTLTIGKDMPFKNAKNGFTLDAGVFYLRDSESSSIILIRSLNLWPALRFQFYFS
jgi:hypothetical protein